ncbi:metal-dependent hydrolase [Chloroflexota bacterium]
MLLFGHSGITLGMAWITHRVVVQKRVNSTKLGPVSKLNADPSREETVLAAGFDYRIVLFGSLLPDIIDKPIGHLLLREIFSNGRILAHTLFFSLLLISVGLILRLRWGKTWLLLLSFGTMIHIVLDQVWRHPKTFLWPLYGLTFDRIELTGWTRRILETSLIDPGVYIPEFVGLVILVWYFIVLVLQHRVSQPGYRLSDTGRGV